jgi:hypothetical protein
MLGISIAVAVQGAACNASVDPIEVAASCPDTPLRGPDQWASEPGDRLIDDFEDGDGRIAKVGNRNGAWTLGTDKSPGNVVAETSSHCSARGTHAGHFSGAGFTDWGANWTAVFVDPTGSTALPYDGRAYSGISFWAAMGSEAMEPFEAPLGLTTMDNAWNSDVCGSKCMDFYGVKVPLTRSWQRVVIRFADLAQAGWGTPQTPMKHDQMVGFIIWPNHQFDIWIDDIRFEP